MLLGISAVGAMDLHSVSTAEPRPALRILGFVSGSGGN